jgi:hypothetical protein
LTITARPAPNAAPARLKVRKNIESLSAQELTDFRRAVKQAIALNDKRGFDYFAGWHGVPLGRCQHHDLLFLPWHRAYLYWLELALQSRVPGVTLPADMAVHDTLRVWMGGTMGQVDWAAYDPIFSAHHANVDRAWRIWQAAHPGANPPANILGQSLQTDPAMKVRATLAAAAR